MLSLIFTVFHVHYGICVVSEMSHHLNIDPLRIKNYGEVRLISSKNDIKDDASDSDDDTDFNEHVAISDLEVCVVAKSNSGLAGHSAPEKPVNVLQV